MKIKTILKFIFVEIIVITFIIIGFFAYECCQYAKAIQDDTRRKLKEEKDYIIRLSFDGVIVEKIYNINYKRNPYSITILLHQIEPKPLKEKGYYTYYNFTCDSLLTICLPQHVYNQIEIGEIIEKKINDYSIEVGGKKMLILSSDENRWLPKRNG
jgi:hypothetical protein